MKSTQKNWVIKQLRTNGEISRNEALRNFVSRLGAIILTLRKSGMKIDAEFRENDYYYILKDKPTIIPIKVNGVEVTRKIIWETK